MPGQKQTQENSSDFSIKTEGDSGFIARCGEYGDSISLGNIRNNLLFLLSMIVLYSAEAQTTLPNNSLSPTSAPSISLSSAPPVTQFFINTTRPPDSASLSTTGKWVEIGILAGFVSFAIMTAVLLCGYARNFWKYETIEDGVRTGLDNPLDDPEGASRRTLDPSEVPDVGQEKEYQKPPMGPSR
jgi:hypothetical protein